MHPGQVSEQRLTKLIKVFKKRKEQSEIEVEAEMVGVKE